MHWGGEMIHSVFFSRVLGAQPWFSKCILKGESSSMSSLVPLCFIITIMPFLTFSLVIFKNFTGVFWVFFLSKPHLHLKKSENCSLEKELLPLGQPWQQESHSEGATDARRSTERSIPFLLEPQAGPHSLCQWEVTHGGEGE